METTAIVQLVLVLIAVLIIMHIASVGLEVARSVLLIIDYCKGMRKAGRGYGYRKIKKLAAAIAAEGGDDDG